MRFAPLSLILAAAMAFPAGAQTLDRIRETGEIRIGYRTDAAPLSFANSEGIPSGYAPILCAQVAAAVAEHLGIPEVKTEFIAVNTENRFEKVVSGEIDLLCGAATITLERRKLVDFSDPIYVDGTSVLLPIGASDDFADLAGKKVGVLEGTTTADALATTLERTGVEVETVEFPSHDAGVDALKAGEIHAYFADQSILIYQYVQDRLGDTFRLTDQILTVEKQGLAMARGDSDFRLVVDTALSRMYANGSMKKLYDRTLPGFTPGAGIKAMHLLAPTLP